MTHEEFLYQKYKAEQKWKQSTEYKIMKAVAIIVFIIAVIGSGIILFIGE